MVKNMPDNYSIWIPDEQEVMLIALDTGGEHLLVSDRISDLDTAIEIAKAAQDSGNLKTRYVIIRTLFA